MSHALFRAMIWVITAAAIALVFAGWHFFRTRSRRAKKIIFLAALVLVAGVAVYGAGRHLLGKKAMEEHWNRQVAALENFVDERQAGLDELGASLDRFSKMVAAPGWPPAGRQEGTAEGEPGLLLWGDELRGEQERAYGDLAAARDLVELSANRDAVVEVYGGQPIDRLEKDFELASRPLVMLAEIRKLVRPEVTDLKFEQGSVKGTFTPGSVAFVVVVVDSKTGRRIAQGPGQATSSAKVRITANPEAIMSDLWQNTEQAARALAGKLLGRPPR